MEIRNGLLFRATTCCCNRYPRKTESSCMTFGMWKSILEQSTEQQQQERYTQRRTVWLYTSVGRFERIVCSQYKRKICIEVYRLYLAIVVCETAIVSVCADEPRHSVSFKWRSKFMSMWFGSVRVARSTQCINRWFDCIFN